MHSADSPDDLRGNPLDDLLASFRPHLRAAVKAPRTIELYSQSVSYFSVGLTGKKRPATLEEPTRHAISAWPAGLSETPSPRRSPCGCAARAIESAAQTR